MLSSLQAVRRGALVLLVACACSDPGSEPPTLELANFRILEGRVVGGGQVDVEHFPGMAADGYSLVVNLRSEGEPFPENEGELAQAAGMNYLHMPLGGDDLVADHATALAAALRAAGGAESAAVAVQQALRVAGELFGAGVAAAAASGYLTTLAMRATQPQPQPQAQARVLAREDGLEQEEASLVRQPHLPSREQRS